MLRWVFVAVAFQLACLQTEPIDLAADAADSRDEVQHEVAETDELAEPNVEATVEATPETLLAPCISVTPSQVVFGGRLIGSVATIDVTIMSCGAEPLVISDFALTGSDDFTITNATPATLPPTSAMTLSVQFTPSVVALIGADGNPVTSQASLTIRSNAPGESLVIPIEGFGAASDCPTAVIQVLEGDEVLPQTNLHLNGSASTAQAGANIVGYEWTVIQPNGSASTLIPSASVVAPRFEANVYGTYTFRLDVVDAFGNRSCAPAEHVVNVTGANAIHVEVLWHTANDPDETDGNGADIDLHFLHPLSGGALFDTSFDCFWNNTRPNWGVLGDASDDPSLDRDDSDGTGPENLSLEVPEQNVRYQVSVQYWDDHDFGASEVTVRIYVYGILRDQWTTTLVKDDQWDTHYIDWPSGAVTRIGGGTPQVTHDAVPPDYFVP